MLAAPLIPAWLASVLIVHAAPDGGAPENACTLKSYTGTPPSRRGRQHLGRRSVVGAARDLHAALIHLQQRREIIWPCALDVPELPGGIDQDRRHEARVTEHRLLQLSRETSSALQPSGPRERLRHHRLVQRLRQSIPQDQPDGLQVGLHALYVRDVDSAVTSRVRRVFLSIPDRHPAARHRMADPCI
jgi:hypothetical protein